MEKDTKKISLKSMNEPKLKVVAMPHNTNPAGNIFGGWIMTQIDLAGNIATKELSLERVVTVAVDKVVFKEPVFVGDIVCCYAEIVNIGSTSITVEVEVFVDRINEKNSMSHISVASALLTFVNVTKDGKKKIIDPSVKERYGFKD